MKANPHLQCLLATSLLAIVLLVGCAPQVAPLPATAPGGTLPSETSPPYPPPVTPGDLLNSTGYPAPAPSVTSAQVTASQTPAGPTPTPELLAYQRNAWQTISPDGRYAARVVVALPQLPDGSLVGDTYHVQASLVDFQNGSQQVVLDEWRNWGMGYTTPQVLGWSADSQSVYLVEGGVPDGCGPAFFENLLRVEVESGAATSLEIDPGRALALSPDGSRLVSISEGQILDYALDTGDQSTIPFEMPATEGWLGTPAMSPEGRRLLFPVLLNPCSASEDRSGSLYLADLAGASVRTLLEDDPRQLSPLSWPLDDLVQLGDSEGQDYWLQVSSGQISEEPPAEIAAVRQALYGFFAALQAGDYETAAGLYGGTYDVLQEFDPSIDPSDQAALLENGCRLLQCLPVYRAVLQNQPAEGEYRFRVSFDQDGQIFTLGPCCGADIADMPPQSEFIYTVKQDEAGNYRVQGLPVYVP